LSGRLWGPREEGKLRDCESLDKDRESLGKGRGSPGRDSLAKDRELGKLVRQFVFSGSTRPSGIAVGNGRIYLSDTSQNCIHIFHGDGRLLCVWGSEGEARGQLRDPTGVAISKGELFVSDRGNHRIQVFGPQGTVVRGWGTKGRAWGQLNSPAYLAVSDGSVFVADTQNDRVQVFRKNGEVLRVLDSIRSPRGLAILGDELLVTYRQISSVF